MCCFSAVPRVPAKVSARWQWPSTLQIVIDCRCDAVERYSEALCRPVTA